MSYMIYIIIAVIILAAIAMFFLRGGKEDKSPSSPPAATPKPIEQANSQPVPESTPAPAPIAERDYVSNAQDFITQQRYDDAIAELKTGLKKKPQNSAMMLKLLNVYAITNRPDDFDNLFNNIQSNSGSDTIEQANSLRSMMDEEAELKRASMVKNDKPKVDNSDKPLDFDLFDETDNKDTGVEETDAEELTIASPVATQTSTDSNTTKKDEDIISFDDLESQLLDSGDLSSDTSTLSPTDDTTFSMNTDDLSTDSLSMNNLETDSLDTDSLETDSFDFESALETKDDALNQDDAFDFSFDEPADEVANSSTAVNDGLTDTLNTQTPIQELNFEEVDASIEENVLTFDEIESNAETQAQVELKAPKENELTFESPRSQTTTNESLSTSNVEDLSAQTLQDSDVTEDNSQEIELDWDEQLDETIIDISASEVASVKTDSDKTGSDKTKIGTSDNSATSQTPTKSMDYDDTFAQLDALSTDSILGIDTSETSSDEPDAVSDSAQEALLTTGGGLAPNLDDSEFMKSFDFVEDLDNSQVTLDLANQYLELGEYDSAKRLVTEIMQSDSTNVQKTAAQDILARMN